MEVFAGIAYLAAILGGVKVLLYFSKEDKSRGYDSLPE